MHQFGDIVLVAFPFSDNSGYKKRPALVLSDLNDGDVLVARISTQTTESTFDIEHRNWKESGLLALSFARLHKIATLNTSLVDRRLGKLSSSDIENVSLKLQALFNSIIKNT
ncbi:MAG: type II toxin-antitoxin system PemK/MazF family toxin [Lewinellaceae bacterium]|nr:type II toxin-antitoxin system PemK/MazF family toxin [Saprospiraceae bacterium]MCB9339743.1 type II toxin-antitoxin system PemK/MazF family toxin [Lewinellaceae bacterium]